VDRRKLAPIVDNLAAEFIDRFSRETLWGLVEDTAAGFDGAKIEQFVPVLVGRHARERLRAAVRTDSLSLGDRGAVSHTR
jgi:hypothetical protein